MSDTDPDPPRRDVLARSGPEQDAAVAPPFDRDHEHGPSPRADLVRPLPETVVPPGETPAAVCPYCDRPFRSDRARALHVGECHPQATAPERAAYEAAWQAESDDLWVFHLKVFLALGAVYAGFVVAAVVAFSLVG
jgi:hypothetical protein